MLTDSDNKNIYSDRSEQQSMRGHEGRDDPEPAPASAHT